MNTETLSSSLSTNDKRRILTAQGRTTTPGVFSMLPDAPRAPEVEVADTAPVSGVGDSVAVIGEKQISGQQVVIRENQIPAQQAPEDPMCSIKTPPVEVVMNPPVSKIHTEDPKGSFSFYTRPFKVSGKQAWECAMRSLGSIDTLFNRYGYVDSNHRKEISSKCKEPGKATSHNILAEAVTPSTTNA